MNDLVTSQKVFLNKRLSTLFPGVTCSGTAPANNTTFVAGTWPAAQGRSGMLTQPSFLWSASDPAKTSIVKRGKMIHDDVVCQDVLPPPIDLGSPQALNVIGCKSPDGTTSLSTCDSEILESDARTFSMLNHVAAIVFMGAGFGWVAPLIFWLMYKDRSLLVREHAREELNLQISIIVWSAIALGFSIVTLGVGAFVAIPVLVVLVLVAFVMQILAAIAAYRGQYYHYGLAFPFIR